MTGGAVGGLEPLNGRGEAVAFLESLVVRGGSSYTLRTYALGIEHFLAWLTSRRAELHEVDRAEIVDYTAQFARGERDGGSVRCSV